MTGEIVRTEPRIFIPFLYKMRRKRWSYFLEGPTSSAKGVGVTLSHNSSEYLPEGKS